MVVMMLMLAVMGLRTTTMTGRTLRRMVSVPSDVLVWRRMSRTGAEERVVAGSLVWSPESWRAAVGIAGVDVVEDELPDPPGGR